jgi:hypothetical protein
MIPIYINNRDRLTTTRRLAEQCARLTLAEVIIVDNASTYPPLLEWYQDCPFRVERLEANRGPRGVWTCPRLETHKELGITHYVVTDPDLDLEGVPRDALTLLEDGLTRYPWAIKAGLSLAIDDLPDAYQRKKQVLSREARFWTDPVDAEFFKSEIDTTFAMYRVPDAWGGYGPALRTARPYTARHVPWYTAEGQESDEETYYLKHLSTQGIFWSALAQERFR